MKVMVETPCGRCSRATKEEMQIEEANTLHEGALRRDAVCKELVSKTKELLTSADHAPALMIAYVTPTGTYDVKVLNDLCSKGNGKSKGGCQSRVDALLKELFLEGPKKTPQPRKKKAAPAANTTPQQSTEG